MSYQDWLLKHNPYCDVCVAPIPAIRIMDIRGKLWALCGKHYRCITNQKEEHKHEHSNA